MRCKGVLSTANLNTSERQLEHNRTDVMYVIYVSEG